MISVITPTIRPEGLKILQESLAQQTFKDFEWLVDVGLKNEHDLNKAYNRLLRRASGELVVSLQDYIKAPPDYLQRFWDAYQKYPDTFFTAPVGKVDNLEYKVPAKWDWRAYKRPETTDAIEATWDCWEIDSGAASLAALKKIGGFDEELDKYWSCDNVNVGYRAFLDGYKFMNLFTNPVLVYDHDAFEKHPFRENYKPAFNNERMRRFESGLKLHYLD